MDPDLQTEALRKFKRWVLGNPNFCVLNPIEVLNYKI